MIMFAQSLLLIFFTWHYALRCGYISDDHATVEARKDIIPDGEKHPRKEKYWIKVFNDGIVLHYWDAAIDKLKLRQFVFIWHLSVLSLHLGNCYLLVKILSPFFGQETALIAMVFWAVNPMLNQNTVWISGRPYLVSVFLIFIAILFWQYPFIVLPLYAIAINTNISIGLFPILIKILYPHVWQSNFYLIFMFVIGGPFVVWKFCQRFSSKALVLDRENFRFRKRRFNVISRVYGYYVWAFFVPIKMGWYHQAGFSYNRAWEKFNFWTLCSYILVFGLRKLGFGGWWFLLGMIPNMNLFATNSFLQDRYLYFGSIGLSILVAPWFIKYPILFYVAMTFYCTRSYMYSRHLVDDEQLYRENCRIHPLSDYAFNNLAFFLIQKKKWDEARILLLRGIEINNKNKMIWYNLGVTWAGQGNFKNDEGKLRFLRALDCWKMALQIEPRWAKPAEDLNKLVKLLLENKVLTKDKTDAVGPRIDIPMIGDINKLCET